MESTIMYWQNRQIATELFRTTVDISGKPRDNVTLRYRLSEKLEAKLMRNPNHKTDLQVSTGPN